MINQEFILKDLQITQAQRKSRSDYNEFGIQETEFLTSEQLSLIPDVISRHTLSDFQKSQLALGVLEIEKTGETFKILDNKILRSSLTENLGTQHTFLYENEIEYHNIVLSEEQEHHLDIQKTHLEQWKYVLRPDVYRQLEHFINKSNLNLAGDKKIIRGGLMDEYVDTIKHDIYKANRHRYERLPEDLSNVIDYGKEITTKWRSEKDKVESVINDNSLAYPLRALKLDSIKSTAIQKEVSLFMEKYLPKGNLENKPKELISKLFENQLDQNLGDIKPYIFENNIDAQKNEGGFDWDKTPEKTSFWSSVIRGEDLDLFYKEFPKAPQVGETMIDAINNFLKTYTPKGDIMGFPKEILAKLLLYQTSQQTFETLIFKDRIAVFEKQVYMPLEYGGFDPWSTVEGESFWANVIHDRNWDMYFEKYPEIIFSESDKITIDIENYIGKGQLSGYPTEVISIMLTEQVNQNNPMNIEVFEKNIKANEIEGGFNWKATDKGEDYFKNMITWKVFSLAYNEFPVIPYTKEVFLETDLHSYIPSGQISNLPKEIIEEMLREQIHQGNPENISIFEEYGLPEREFGGFSTAENRLGLEVWDEIRQNNGEFSKFFEEMPDQKYDNSHLNNNNLLR